MRFDDRVGGGRVVGRSSGPGGRVAAYCELQASGGPGSEGKGPGRGCCGSRVVELRCGRSRPPSSPCRPQGSQTGQGMSTPGSRDMEVVRVFGILELTYPARSGWLRLARVTREDASSGPRSACGAWNSATCRESGCPGKRRSAQPTSEDACTCRPGLPWRREAGGGQCLQWWQWLQQRHLRRSARPTALHVGSADRPPLLVGATDRTDCSASTSPLHHPSPWSAQPTRSAASASPIFLADHLPARLFAGAPRYATCGRVLRAAG